MRFSRLVMAGDEIPATEIEFDELITVVDLPPSALTDVHVALASVLRGQPLQGAALRCSGYIELGGLEIEVAGDLAQHFGGPLAGRERIVGALSQRRLVSKAPLLEASEPGAGPASESDGAAGGAGTPRRSGPPADQGAEIDEALASGGRAEAGAALVLDVVQRPGPSRRSPPAGVGRIAASPRASCELRGGRRPLGNHGCATRRSLAGQALGVEAAISNGCVAPKAEAPRHR